MKATRKVELEGSSSSSFVLGASLPSRSSTLEMVPKPQTQIILLTEIL